jgi:hypothetical protein
MDSIPRRDPVDCIVRGLRYCQMEQRRRDFSEGRSRGEAVG